MSNGLSKSFSVIGGNAPVDAQTIIKDADAAIGLRVVEVVALILEHGRLAQHREAMGEATRHKKLAMVVFGQFHRHMLAVGGRSLADIHRHIEHGTLHTPHQLALGERWALEMQATHHTIAAHALIVLAEVDVTHLLVKLPLRKTLEEISTSVLEDTRLNDHHALNLSLYYFHSVFI